MLTGTGGGASFETDLQHPTALSRGVCICTLLEELADYMRSKA